ncbi:hypothetical protein HMN09_00462600 [Mycena chlorophos]|uniref:MYND-type domain-containing protein n=1 Tax=Mycena chlorophos TaxID=658473 RepID=A0A8H6TGI3_MYCCL|nr:hypothetical protein HMN09_00462600 [Mycena chlorophos]
MKVEGEDGVKLLKCGKCGIVKYCSKNCQKANWALHKSGCRADDSSLALGKIVKTFHSSPLLAVNLMHCFISAFKMTSLPISCFATVPFFARVDIATEPKEVLDFYNLVMALGQAQHGGSPVPDSLYKVCAAPQIHSFEPLPAEVRLPENAYAVWRTRREEMNKVGYSHVPLAMCIYAKSHSPRLVEMAMLPVAQPALEEMRRNPKIQSTVNGQTVIRPANVESLLDVMNLHIRQDLKTLGFQTTLSKLDIQVLREYVEKKDVTEKARGRDWERAHYGAWLMRRRWSREHAPKLVLGIGPKPAPCA